MRIGIDIRNIGKKRTGDEVVFFNLVKSLRITNSYETTKNIFFLFTDIIDKNKLEEIEKSLGIESSDDFKIISLKSANKFVWNFWTLPRYLRQNPVDIYVTQYITPWFVPRKIKIVTFIHDVSFKAYSQFIKFSDLFFLNWLIPISLKRADKIIAVSHFTKDEILKYYAVVPEKIEWIHNAVGDNFHREIPSAEIETVRKKYNFPEKFILYIGTLQPRKNLPTLVAAYAKLPEEIRNEYKLVLAGGKGHNFDSKIDRAIKEFKLNDKVLLPGYIDEADKPAIFATSSLFCNPSFYEGFGITVLEAMTLGIPTIASDIPPHREVAENGVFFFNPVNASELTENLKRVLIKKEFGEVMREKSLIQAQKFSWLKTAEKVRQILAEL